MEGRIKHDQNKAGAGSRDSRDVTRSQSPVTENVSEQYLACAGPGNTEPQLNNDLNRFLRLPAAVLIAATLAGGGEDILVGRQQQI